FQNVHFRPEVMRAGYPAVFLRLAWYYMRKGRAARRFFWGSLWKTLRQAPRIVGQMIIYMGMYVHFCEVHGLALHWDPWAAPSKSGKTPAPVAAPHQWQRLEPKSNRRQKAALVGERVAKGR